MKLKDLITIPESSGSANPYVVMASSLDFALKQVQNLEKLISGIHSGVQPGKQKDDVLDLAQAINRYISKAADNLKLARATVTSHSDAPITKD